MIPNMERPHDSVKQDLAEVPTLKGQALSARMGAHVERVKREKYRGFARWYDLAEGIPEMLGIYRLRRGPPGRSQDHPSRPAFPRSISRH
jgi:hypothetical protein